MRRRVLAAALLCAAGQVVATGPAGATEALAQCPAAAVRTFVPGGVPILDWHDTLGSDGLGNLWVTHLLANEVQRVNANGVVTGSVPVSSPGGIQRGPDGLMYVVTGLLPGAGTGALMRFDPREATPVAHQFGPTLTTNVNGLAVVGDGNFYVTGQLAPSVTRIRPDGTVDRAWTAAAKVFGTNGAAVAGDTLYVSVFLDLQSTVYRIPLANPAGYSQVTRLSLAGPGSGPLPKLLDDLTVGPDGQIYLAAAGSNELLRIDPTTGTTCVVAAGLAVPTSVRFPDNVAGLDPRHDALVPEATGPVLRVTLG